MTASRIKVSVVLCAYTEKRWEDLVAAIGSLQRQSLPPYELILVIDHHARLFRRARERFPQLNVIENSGKQGLSGARNTGIAAAQGDVVAFIDEDAVAEADWVERLLESYTGPEVIGVGGVIEPLWLQGRPGWFPEEFDWVVGCTYRGMPSEPAAVRNLIGCNMSFRREVFDAMGGFQNDMGRIGTRPLGCEETEFCIRAQKNWSGGVLLYQPGARVHHRVPAWRANWRYFRQRCYAEGLSKAQVAAFVGQRDGLASERRYTLKTLPSGVIRGVIDAVRTRKPDSLARAAAIIVGLLITTVGYLVGRISAGLSRSKHLDYSRNSVPLPDRLD